MALLALPCNFFPWRGLSPGREDEEMVCWDGRPSAISSLTPILLLRLLHLTSQ